MFFWGRNSFFKYFLPHQVDSIFHPRVFCICFIFFHDQENRIYLKNSVAVHLKCIKNLHLCNFAAKQSPIFTEFFSLHLNICNENKSDFAITALSNYNFPLLMDSFFHNEKQYLSTTPVYILVSFFLYFSSNFYTIINLVSIKWYSMINKLGFLKNKSKNELQPTILSSVISFSFFLLTCI